jgi:hypothetical protein
VTLGPEAMRAAGVAARLVARRFETFVDRDDLEMDAVEWLLRHPQRIEHATFEDGGVNLGQLVAEIAPVLARTARREKMRALGMDPREQSKYTRVAVERALPAVWDPGYRPSRAEGRGASDPATRGAWEATVLDMKRAVGEVCTREDERVLFTTYALEARGREAEFFSKTPRADVASRSRRIVTQILDFLNGEYTVELDEVDALLVEGPGSRHPISNAHARAIQTSQYGGE